MKPVYKILIVLIIFYSGVVPVFAEETEWVDPQEKTLRLTETFTREGFLIEASDFYDNSALITVYDAKHNIITRNITRINDYFSVNGRLNITVINLQEVSGNISAGHGLNVVVDRWVRIRTRVAGSPVPKVSIIPKSIELNNKIIIRRTFIPGSEIPINFSVKNEGKAKLKNIILKINTSLPVLYGEKVRYEIYELGPGNESDVITVRFQAPSTERQTFFLILAEARGNDVFDMDYSATDSINIDVNPLIGRKIEIKKYISEKIYIGDLGVVSISIKNNLSQKIDNVSLSDSLPAGLEPLDANLSWNFALGPNELKQISYKVRPQKPGTYYLQPGSSVIEYKDELYYNTKPVKLIVNGPYVVLMKSSSSDTPIKGERITIRLDARNIGDSTAIVKLNDRVPANHVLSSENYKEVLNTVVLHPGNSTSFSYELNTSEPGSFVIPPARATVYDQYLYQDERYKQTTSSNDLTLKVKDNKTMELPLVKVTEIPKRTVVPETPKTQTTETPKPAPGFYGYFVIFIILVIARVIKEKISKKDTKYRSIIRILIISLVMFSLILMANQANAYERPEYKDGLDAKWHAGRICLPCHYTILSDAEAKEISRGCSSHCHKSTYRPKDSKNKYKLDMSKIVDLHKDVMCIRCHAGIRNENNITATDFHRMMSKTGCLSCHRFENGTYFKPEKTKCSECHASDPHVVHDKKTEKMCVLCHGDFVENYVNPATQDQVSEKTVDMAREKTTIESPTIGQFISSMIESLIKIIR